MDDADTLSNLNAVFIEAFRQGSRDLLMPILSPSFTFLDGATGETWTRERYVASLEQNALPTLAIDQVNIHFDGNAAFVSARTSRGAGSYSRYVDTYERRDGAWLCVHACVWSLPSA